MNVIIRERRRVITNLFFELLSPCFLALVDEEVYSEHRMNERSARALLHFLARGNVLGVKLYAKLTLLSFLFITTTRNKNVQYPVRTYGKESPLREIGRTRFP